MTPKTKQRIGWVLSGLVILFLLMDGLGKIFQPTEVVEATLGLGYKQHHLPIMGILPLLISVLYAMPYTSLLGAVIMTGYLGGAVATNMRVDAPLFSHILFPVYLGILAWTGLLLRNNRSQLFHF